MDTKNLIHLDCTLRDGGYYNSWDFPDTLIYPYLEAMAAINIDIVELGMRSLKNDSYKGACAYTTDTFLASLPLPPELHVGVMVNASELLDELNLEEALNKLFPLDAKSSMVKLVRIACHIHEFQPALPASNWLKKRGFLVGFNLMQVADREKQEVQTLAAAAAAYPIDVLYFADSMGSMNPENVAEIISWIRSKWNGALGIHTHDNLGLALSNSLRAISEGATWVDSTVTGMGRGPGNAFTEELAIEIAQRRGQALNLVPLMRLIRQHFKPMQQEHGWGTNPYYYQAGKYGIHPTYIQEMLSDSRYDEEDILAVIEHLRIEGGKKFSFNTLDVARQFYQGSPQGNWLPSSYFRGRTILLLGSGNGVKQHRSALEAFIHKHRPVVVALNTQTGIEAELIDFRVACHPVRLLADCEAHARLPQPLITPYSMLPDDIKTALKNKKILDFGLQIHADKFEFSQYYCTLPTSLVVAYALAVVTSGQGSKIFMAGFDGYAADDPRTQEMQHLLEIYHQSSSALTLESITPTRYNLPTSSVYAL